MKSDILIHFSTADIELGAKQGILYRQIAEEQTSNLDMLLFQTVEISNKLRPQYLFPLYSQHYFRFNLDRYNYISRLMSILSSFFLRVFGACMWVS